MAASNSFPGEVLGVPQHKWFQLVARSIYLDAESAMSPAMKGGETKPSPARAIGNFSWSLIVPEETYSSGSFSRVRGFRSHPYEYSRGLTSLYENSDAPLESNRRYVQIERVNLGAGVSDLLSRNGIQLLQKKMDRWATMGRVATAERELERDKTIALEADRTGIGKDGIQSCEVAFLYTLCW